MGDGAADEDFARAVGWFPVVGLLLGLLLAAADSAIRLVLPPPSASAMVIALWVAATGALHLDGLIDTADGLAGGSNPDERLAAMRQTVAGTSGAAVGILAPLAAYAALSALPDGIRSAALILSPVCARAAILLGYRVFPYPRREATASAILKQGASTLATAGGMAFTLLVAGLVAGAGGLALVVLPVALTLMLGALAAPRFGGLTGDVHGALCELAQLAALFAAPYLLRT